MKEIELKIELLGSGRAKAITIAEDAAVEQLLELIRAADAAAGEPGEIILWVENKEITHRKGQKVHEIGIKHGHHVHWYWRKIFVKVAYTGHDEYEAELPREDTIGMVKLKAMKAFEIELSAADKYVIQHDGVNLEDKVKLGTLGRREAKLVLLLKKPQEKGHGG
jgi:hypothetical protein